jgi:hypothetical protein
VDKRFFVLRLLHLGQAIFSTGALLRTSFSKDTPQLVQSYSKIGIRWSPMEYGVNFKPSGQRRAQSRIL